MLWQFLPVVVRGHRGSITDRPFGFVVDLVGWQETMTEFKRLSIVGFTHATHTWPL